MSKFYFGSGSGSISSDDEDNLPYPEALPRSDFLSPNFDAPTYLSTLSDRHQTLEDLRSDLRDRSQTLSQELLDLVNANYEQFLSLGSDLKGGEDKVEDIRVGLLGFRRGVEDVRRSVRERKAEVQGLLEEKKAVGREITTGRRLLEIDARLEELEDRLMVTSLGRPASADREEDAWSDSEEEEMDEEDLTAGDGVSGTTIRKLQSLVTDCRRVERLLASIGTNHPFIAAQEPRMFGVRNTIVLDLNTSLKHAVGLGEGGRQRVVKVLGIYQDLGAGDEAIKILKDLRSR